MRYDLRSLKPIEAQETQALAHNSTMSGQLLKLVGRLGDSGVGEWGIPTPSRTFAPRRPCQI